MSIVSGTLAAVNAKKSASQANRTNRKLAQQANQSNFILDLVKRGLPIPAEINGLKVPEGAAGVSSALLPFYMAQQEAQLSDYASDAFDELSSPEVMGSIGDFRATANRYQPAIDAGRDVVSGIYNGDITNEELGLARPVAEARMGVAKDAGLESLRETLNSIKSIQARRGFSGDSTASNRLSFDARRRVAMDVAGANLGNAMEERAIRQGGINRRLAGLDMPLSQANREFALGDLPGRTLRNRLESNVSIFNPFRTGGGFQRVEAAPREDAVPNTMGIIAAGIGSMNQNAGQILANNSDKWFTRSGGTGRGYGPQNVSASSNSNFGGSNSYGGGQGYYSDAGGMGTTDWGAGAGGDMTTWGS